MKLTPGVLIHIPAYVHIDSGYVLEINAKREILLGMWIMRVSRHFFLTNCILVQLRLSEISRAQRLGKHCSCHLQGERVLEDSGSRISYKTGSRWEGPLQTPTLGVLVAEGFNVLGRQTELWSTEGKV
jgi:hypothetical protein